jgi:hypothetical protein
VDDDVMQAALKRLTIQTAPDPKWKGAPPLRWIRLAEVLEQYVAPHEGSWDYGPWGLLRTARNLYLHSWFVADFGQVAVLVAYQAVESAFRYLYPHRERDKFEALIKRAAADGHLRGDHVAWVNDLREMRNLLSHPVAQTSVEGIGNPDTMLMYAHEIVVRIMNAGTPTRDPDEIEGVLRFIHAQWEAEKSG